MPTEDSQTESSSGKPWKKKFKLSLKIFKKKRSRKLKDIEEQNTELSESIHPRSHRTRSTNIPPPVIPSQAEVATESTTLSLVTPLDSNMTEDILKGEKASVPAAKQATSASEEAKPKGKKEKVKPADLKIPPKKPKLTKAERRALQEKQRAAKAANNNSGGGNKKKGVTADNEKQNPANKKKEVSVVSEGNPEVQDQSSSGVGKENEIIDKAYQMFSHLPQYHDRSNVSHLSGVKLHSSDKNIKVKLHPTVLDLGMKYSSGVIRGANARCRAMLEVFKVAIQDYSMPSVEITSGSNSSRMIPIDIPSLLDQQVIKPSFQHWTTSCRPHSVTMGNAVNFLKVAIANLPRDISLKEAKEVISDQIDAYIQERINFADKLITKHGLSKISDGDVILVYGKSEVIQSLLFAAVEAGKDFRVIVTDSRPLLEGREMLHDLVEYDIPCTYILLNSLSYVMVKEVTKVFLGAAALMSDGSVMNRIGTASVALMAKSHNIPVLFCCESYKISNRVQLESFTHNELGNPKEIAMISSTPTDDSDPKSILDLDHAEKIKNLRLLNLTYDLTPREFVSGIITELGILPPTSVAVILREMNQNFTTY